MQDSDEVKQKEEIEMLFIVYPDLVKKVNEKQYKIFISNTFDQNPLVLSITLCDDYPSINPPGFELYADWLTDELLSTLCSKLLDIYDENEHDVIIYQWIVFLTEYITDEAFLESRKKSLLGNHESKENKIINSNAIIDENSQIGKLVCPDIVSGETITDRKSVFQAHVAPLNSPSLVPIILNELYKNKKIEKATHNIWAYRIYNESSNTYIQDNDDDGESAAGGRLGLLLEMTDVRNALVIVSRWWGGPLLGSSRFKRICDVARNLLEKEGYIHEAENKK
ncbi:hypothetical protein WA158_005261 [Blastocystis sp. Blastoise]